MLTTKKYNINFIILSFIIAILYRPENIELSVMVYQVGNCKM